MEKQQQRTLFADWWQHGLSSRANTAITKVAKAITADKSTKKKTILFRFLKFL